MASKQLLTFLLALYICMCTRHIAAQDTEEAELSPMETKMKDSCYQYTCKDPSYAICVSKEINGILEPVCECPESCPDVLEPVCTVYGKQYDSKCHLRLYACQKKRPYPLAYEAPCIASQERCGEDELKEFPHRLLEWFLHLYEIDELAGLDSNSSIRKLDDTGRENIAAWKFNLLDRKKDGVLDRRDLREFRYRLMPLEHCANDFFQSCFQQAKSVDLDRWYDCLKVRDAHWKNRSAAEVFINVVPKESPKEKDY